MGYRELDIASRGELSKKCLDFLKEKIIDAFIMGSEKAVVIYMSLDDMLGGALSLDPSGDFIVTERGFCFVPEDDHMGVFHSVYFGKKYRTRQELLKTLHSVQCDDELNAFLLALKEEGFIKNFTYLGYGRISKEDTGSPYLHLMKKDSALNKYSSIFRKPPLDGSVTYKGKTIRMTDVSLEESYITKELLVFSVGYYSVELYPDFGEKFCPPEKIPHTEIYSIPNNWIVNVNNRAFLKGDITRAVRLNNKKEESKSWMILLELLRSGGSIEVPKYKVGTQEASEVLNNYNLVRKFLKNYTGDELVILSDGCMILENVKKL